MNERKTKGLTNLNSDEKSFDKLVCPWPECIFTQFAAISCLTFYWGLLGEQKNLNAYSNIKSSKNSIDYISQIQVSITTQTTDDHNAL